MNISTLADQLGTAVSDISEYCVNRLGLQIFEKNAFITPAEERSIRRAFAARAELIKEIKCISSYLDQGYLLLLDPDVLREESKGILRFLKKMHIILSSSDAVLWLPCVKNFAEFISAIPSETVKMVKLMYESGTLMPDQNGQSGILAEELIYLRCVKKDALLFTQNAAAAEDACRINCFRSIEDKKRNIKSELRVQMISPDGVCTDHAGINTPSGFVFDYNQDYLFLSEAMQKSSSYIRSCLDNNFEIIIDTCSIMGEGAAKFLQSIRPILNRYKKKVWLSCSSVKELKRLSTLYNSQMSLETAETMSAMINEGSLGTIGNQTDESFFDGILLQKLIMLLANKQNILLLSQDYDLTNDVLCLNSFHTIGKDDKAIVTVMKIHPEGFIEKNNHVFNPKLPG